jgi:hypothetical protein
VSLRALHHIIQQGGFRQSCRPASLCISSLRVRSPPHLHRVRSAGELLDNALLLESSDPRAAPLEPGVAAAGFRWLSGPVTTTPQRLSLRPHQTAYLRRTTPFKSSVYLIFTPESTDGVQTSGLHPLECSSVSFLDEINLKGACFDCTRGQQQQNKLNSSPTTTTVHHRLQPSTTITRHPSPSTSSRQPSTARFFVFILSSSSSTIVYSSPAILRPTPPCTVKLKHCQISDLRGNVSSSVFPAWDAGTTRLHGAITV